MSGLSDVKKVQIKVNVDPDVASFLRQMARQKRVSISECVRSIITEFILIGNADEIHKKLDAVLLQLDQLQQDHGKLKLPKSVDIAIRRTEIAMEGLVIGQNSNGKANWSKVVDQADKEFRDEPGV